MNAVADLRRPPLRWRRILILLAGGAGLGLAAGFAIGRLIKSAGRAQALGWSDSLSLALAALLLLGGAGIVLATLADTGAAYLADPHAEEPGRRVRPAQRAYFRLQGGVMVLAGGLMATPELLRLLSPALGRSTAAAAMAGIVVAFALQTLLNLQIWRRSDELIRRVTADGAAVCFWLLQGLLFLWAAGEKLSLLPPLNSWDALTVLMAVYLALSALVAWRRGLG